MAERNCLQLTTELKMVFRERHRIFADCAVFAILPVFTVYWLLIGKVQICIFRIFSGLPCPGCGLTRAGTAMLRGNWAESFRMHPFLLPVLFCLTTFCFRKIKPFRFLHESRYFYIIFLICYTAFYIFRLAVYFPGGPDPMVFDEASLAGMMKKLICN